MTRKSLATAVFIWLASVSYGLGFLYNYSLKPANMQQVLKNWPEESKIKFAKNQANLVLFLHPHCQCSEASLAELQKIQAQFHKKFKTHLVFILPEGTEQDWIHTKLWKKSQNLANTELIIDKSLQEAKVFASTSSGQVYLFNKERELIFLGGITSARGHQGDSIGNSAIKAYFRSGNMSVEKAPSFGCSLS